ncbi:Phosphoglucomutase-3 [Podochytrium sp. JEL0797]|nr:Phosphoglucomutase-3 [Podochytrium sp. JEL0797]
MDTQLSALAQKWLDLDKDEKTRAEIQQLLAANNTPELKRRLGTYIRFGTAGLRAAMEAGFAGMNNLTVIQASQGLASYIARTVPNAKKRGFVVGHDHRHNSETFARLTAAVFLEYGFKVYFYKGLVHTPMVPFAITHLNLSGGLMTEILKDAYFATIKNLIATPVETIRASPLRYVYTAMHGVGLPFVERVLSTFGMKSATLVAEQVLPDPEFTTVVFPNPEEKGALDMALALADRESIGLVLANDPDADRLAVAQKRKDGKWHVFTGDQIGTLLGYALVVKMAGKSAEEKKKVAMVNSAASSKMLRSMCQKEGYRYEETLTGFKWMSNCVVDLMKDGYDTFFAYEEAIGFMCHECVLDKDGVTALASFVELAILQEAKGSNMVELLEELYVKYGFHASDNYYFVCHDPVVIGSMFKRIR